MDEWFSNERYGAISSTPACPSPTAARSSAGAGRGGAHFVIFGLEEPRTEVFIAGEDVLVPVITMSRYNTLSAISTPEI